MLKRRAFGVGVVTGVTVILDFKNTLLLDTVKDFAKAADGSRSNHREFYAGDSTLPKVAILMCTFHGQHYLADQLDSFAAQTHTNWEVWASDDGSLDDTHSVLDTYKAKWNHERLC